MIAKDYRGARQWSRNQQAIAIVVWISFLSAAGATMLFFAAFDPVELGGLLDTDLNRDSGYAAGFFFFWLLSAACSGITAWLVRTAPARRRAVD